MKRRNFLKCGISGVGMIACNQVFGDVFKSSMLIDYNSKYSCEALYYKVSAHGITCNLCPNKCNVSDIRPGSCRTKYVKSGKLISTAYGNPYYMKIEAPELESLFHYVPGSKILALGTAGCTLSCQYCKVSDVSQKSPDQTNFTELFPQQAIDHCLKKGIKAIAYTYTEPVAFYEYMLHTAKLAHQHGIKNIMVSNGFISEAPLRELCKYLDAAVIDVKAFNDAAYQKLTGGSIFPVFNTLKILKELNVWTELTHLLVPGWTDNFELLEKMCQWMKQNDFNQTPFHFNKFEPKYRLSQLQPTPDSMLIKAQNLALSAGLSFVYASAGNENTLCPSCRKMLVQRKENKLISNNIKNSNCGFCGKNVPGIWS